MKKLFLIFLTGLMLLVPGWASPQDYSPNRIAPGPREPLNIEIWADRDNEATYREGEQITLYFRANRDCYFALYNIDTRGQLYLLYPQDPNDANFIEGGVTYQIPNPDDNFAYWVTGPAGVEFVQAVASVRPFDLPNNWPASYRGSRAPRGYLSSPIRVDNENIEEFIYETNSRIVPMKSYPDDCAEDLYTFYVEPVRRAYRPVYNDNYYSYGDFDFPYGSEVWIDGVFCGTAPLYRHSLWPGTHLVRVIQPGCPVYVRQIYCYPRSHFSVNFSINFNFGYRNNRYYRVQYPYSYFCYVSPDYRVRYKSFDRDDFRQRVIFDKDVRYKNWVTTKDVRFKDSKKYTPLQEVFKQPSQDDRRRARDFKEADSRNDSRKFSPIYRDWGKSKSQNDGNSPSERKEPARYRTPDEGKKQGSKSWDAGQQEVRPRNSDGGKREEYRPSEKKEPARYRTPDESRNQNGKWDVGQQEVRPRNSDGGKREEYRPAEKKEAARYRTPDEGKNQGGKRWDAGQQEVRPRNSDGGKREEYRPSTSSSNRESAPAVRQAPARQKQDNGGARSKSSDGGKQTRSKKGRDG